MVVLCSYLLLVLIRSLIDDIFSYSEPTKNLLMECAAAHLKHKKFTSTYGSRLTSSSGRILLQSAPGWSQVLQNLIITFFVYFIFFQVIIISRLLCIVEKNKLTMSLLSTGTELYRERLVRALARDLQVPLLVLDSSVLAPYVRLR